MSYDLTFLLNPYNEEAKSIEYYRQSCSFLSEYLKRDEYKNTEHAEIIKGILTYFESGTTDLNKLLDILDNYFTEARSRSGGKLWPDVTKAFTQEEFMPLLFAPLPQLLDTIAQHKNDIDFDHGNNYSYVMSIILALYGIIGKSICYLTNQTSNSILNNQYETEIKRLLTKPDQFISEFFLFYITGLLASGNYPIEFVPERGNNGGQTPDLMVKVQNRQIYIEATAKRPEPDNTVDAFEKLSREINEAINEKKSKFKDKKYQPGMITIDVSTIPITSRGTSIKRDLIRQLSTNGNVYVHELWKDWEYFSDVKNKLTPQVLLAEQLNSESFKKNQIDFVWIGQTMSVVINFLEPSIYFPRRHLLIARRNAEDLIPPEMVVSLYNVNPYPSIYLV